jgi:hypothetical protein
MSFFEDEAPVTTSLNPRFRVSSTIKFIIFFHVGLVYEWCIPFPSLRWLVF